MTLESPGRILRQLVEDSTIQVPGAFNALVARMIAAAGFDAMYVSGAALASSGLGVPDVGLFSLTELVQQVQVITRQTNLPVLVDADVGFGGVMNVQRTVEELERAGAAAIQLEDQQLPKRCGQLSGKSLVDVDMMCAKIRAAVAARRDPNLVIIARTDARGVIGFQDAVARAKHYLAAGADWILPEALETAEEFSRFAHEVDAPLVANMTEFGRGPLLSLSDLAELGYAVVLYPESLLRVAMKGVEAALAMIADSGTQVELLDLMQTRQELYDLLDYQDYQERDQQYFQNPEAN